MRRPGVHLGRRRITTRTDKKHGLQNPEGPHAGDMNNFTVLKDGTAKTTIVAPHMKMGVDAALVVHAGVDDLKTDPAGNAGDRIACGVVVEVATHDAMRRES